VRWRVWIRVASLVRVVAQADRIDRIVGALVDDLEAVLRHGDGQADLHAAGAETARDRHLAAGVGHLVAGHGQGLEQAATHLAHREVVEESEALVAGGW
jgi:hypothetical protein